MFRTFIVLIALVSATVGAVGPSRPDFSGSWQYDPAKSSKNTDWNAENTLVIRQFGDRLEMDRRAGDAQLSTGAYITDGKARPLYRTPIEETFITAAWHKRDLVVTIQHIQRGELSDSQMKDEDRWTLAESGQTLIHKTSDGKNLVFHKVASAAPAAKTH